MGTIPTTQPPFNLETLNLPPPQPPPSVAELRRISAALSQFLRDYDDLHSHISSVNAALDEKLSLHSKGNAVNFNDSVKNVIEGPVVEPNPRDSVSQCVSVVSERKRNESVVDDDVRVHASSDNLNSDSDRVVNDDLEVVVSEGVKNYEQNDGVVVVVNDVLEGVVVLDGKCEGSEDDAGMDESSNYVKKREVSDCDRSVSDDKKEIVLEGSESECERGDGNVKKDEKIIDASVKMEKSDCAEIIIDVSEAVVSEENLNGSESDHIVTEFGDARVSGQISNSAASECEQGDDDVRLDESPNSPDSCKDTDNKGEETDDEDGETEASKKPDDAYYDRIVTELPEDIDVVPKPRAAIDSDQSYDKPQSPNSSKNHLDEIDVSVNPEDENHEQTDVSMEANVSEKYEEMDILKNPAESDVLEKPEEIDITKNPEETDVSKKRKKADVSEKPEEIDITRNPEGTDVSKKLKKADVSKKLRKADVSEKLRKADVSEKRKKADLSEKLKKADVSEKREKADVSEKRKKADVSEKRKKADVSEKRKKADLSEKRKIADVSEKRKKADVSEKTKYVEILKNPKPAVSELEMLCKSMSGRELKKYVVKHILDIDKLRTKLVKALKLAINPAKLVLDSIGTYFLKSSKIYQWDTLQCMKDQKDGREASLLILECFVMISGDGIEISREDEASAAKAANQWKTRMNNERGLKDTEEADARGLLLFISGFGISDCFFSTVDIMNLMRASNLKGISNILRRSIVLMPKIPEVIDMMVMSKLEVEAADIAYTFGLEDKCHPLTILTKFLRSIIDDIESGSHVSKMKQLLDDLTSVKECLESHNLDPSKVLPKFKIDEEIHHLKKELKLQVQKRKGMDIKSLAIRNHHEAKRTCFSHSSKYTPKPLLNAPTLPINITNGGLVVPNGNIRGQQDGSSVLVEKYLVQPNSRQIQTYDTQPSLTGLYGGRPGFPVCMPDRPGYLGYIPSSGVPARRGPSSELYALADVEEKETRGSRAVGSGISYSFMEKHEVLFDNRYSYEDKVAYAYLHNPSKLWNIMPDETGHAPSQGPHSHYKYGL